VPLLAVHGENDQIAPLAGVMAWSRRLPALQLEVIENAGHDVLNEVAHRRVADRAATFVLTCASSGLRA
jgi:pimeloyl-ACP methyl ester carboxylesterase